jgi:hypothetical protein
MDAPDVPGGQWRDLVDGHQFDALTLRLTSIRLTRGGALRGMVAGALALAGMTPVTNEASARKKKSKVCHCGDTAGATCSTMTVKKKQRKMHLTTHQCDYMGACRGNITACAAAPIIVDGGHLGDDCTNTNPCASNSGLECVAGFCVPTDLGNTCTNNGECSTGRCESGACVECPAASVCETTSGAQCCSLSASCVGNVCVL